MGFSEFLRCLSMCPRTQLLPRLLPLCSSATGSNMLAFPSFYQTQGTRAIGQLPDLATSDHASTGLLLQSRGHAQSSTNLCKGVPIAVWIVEAAQAQQRGKVCCILGLRPLEILVLLLSGLQAEVTIRGAEAQVLLRIPCTLLSCLALTHSGSQLYCSPCRSLICLFSEVAGLRFC